MPTADILAMVRTQGGAKQVASAAPPSLPPFKENGMPDTGAMWLSEQESEFGIAVLDCRAFCQRMVSSTDSPHVALSYSQLRSSLGKNHCGQLPNNVQRFECDLKYSYDGKHQDGVVFKSQQMEEKWDIYIYDNMLYFARSWTGDLVFVSEVSFEPTVVRLVSVSANSEAAKNRSYAIACVDYLMKSHVLRGVAVHPFPDDVPNDPDHLAMFSFGQFGRFAAYSTYEDTTKVETAK